MSEPQPPSPQPSPARPPRGGIIGAMLLYTRGMIFDQRLRRLTMFYAVLVAMIMAFPGDFFLGEWLREKLIRFVIWWLVCGWVTVLAALLAVYDLLMIRIQHRLIRRELRERLLKEKDL